MPTINPTSDISVKITQKSHHSSDGKKVIFSFFSGAGFLDLGFEKSGFEVALVNEIHKPFLNAYRFARKEMNIKQPVYGFSNDDISDFLDKKQQDLERMVSEQKDKGAIVGFIGGPPCPDFSVGGKNRGRNGKNGILTGIYTDLIIEQQPDFFLFENVKGLLRTQKHREYYDEIKMKLSCNGYLLTDRLINSIEYGAPQDRDRIILIGFNKNFLEKHANTRMPDGLVDFFPWKIFLKNSKKEIFGFNWPKMNEFMAKFESKNYQVPQELTIDYWFKKNDVLNHPNSKDYLQPKSPRIIKVAEGDVSRKSFKRLHRWRYSPTACYGNNEVHLHPYKPRRISVAEALAIQSLPSDFVLPSNMGLTNMFKAVGNGVPFVAAKGIAESINFFINNISYETNSIRHMFSHQPATQKSSLSLC